MLGGFNTNVPYKDVTYHVQTEDGGTKNPLLITHLYHKGAILGTKQHNYAKLLAEDGWEEKVRMLMKEQHKTFIGDLLAGKLTGDAAPSGVPEEGDLDDIILDYILPPKELAQ
jgi:hypothetical protein